MVQILRPSRPSPAHPRAIEGGGGREALEDAAARVADAAHARAVGVAQVELGHRGRWVALTSYSGLSWKEKKKQKKFQFPFLYVGHVLPISGSPCHGIVGGGGEA